MCNWHTTSAYDIFQILETSKEGLSQHEAESRLLKNGPNELSDQKAKAKLQLFFGQFKDLMILILLGAAVVSGVIGDFSDAIVILVIVFFNAVIGFYQEVRAQNAVLALKKIVVQEAAVLRDGKIAVMPAALLVVGDVVLLETGNGIPADVRIIESTNLKVEEAALTGESASVAKTADVIEQADSLLADRVNLAFKGTFVVYGHGKGVVVATSMDTEIGKIASMLNRETAPAPLQQKMYKFSKKLVLFIALMCVLFFITGWLRGEGTLKMLLTSISLAVAAIPEALTAVIAISLALAARKMIQINVLIRKLSAVETLGSVGFICTDKTGTLTENKMCVTEVCFNNMYYCRDDLLSLINDPAGKLLLYAFALNNDVVRDIDHQYKGDSTEVALMDTVKSLSIPLQDCPRLAEIPFDAERKMMTTFHEIDGKIISFTKGAPDVLLKYSKVADVRFWHQQIQLMAQKGERVLGFAYRYWNDLPLKAESKVHESELQFLGLCGIIDPPRKEALSAVCQCREAGIVPVMITGDHLATARYVATQTGILISDEDLAITGAELLDMDDEEFSRCVNKIKVYARVSPEQKLRIITVLQKIGNYVAMTGDGLNDAPSLKAADIGIAMGISGTDVAKEAADIILLDDNFSSIVAAIRAGRRVYDNVLKLISYLLTTNASEMLTLLIGPLLGLPIVFLPIHILWINLASDGLPAIALSFEQAENDLMTRPPRPPNEDVFSDGRWIHMVWVSMLMGGVALALQSWAFRNELHWQTMVFNMLCLSQMGHAMSIRSLKSSIFKIGFFSNIPMILSVLLVLALQILITYVPIFQKVFHTQSLTVWEFIVVGSTSLLIFLVVELLKVVLGYRKNIR